MSRLAAFGLLAGVLSAFTLALPSYGQKTTHEDITAPSGAVPNFAGVWGRPLLLGPGSIHVAHTSEERISKRDLEEAVGIYERMVKELSAEAV